MVHYDKNAIEQVLRNAIETMLDELHIEEDKHNEHMEE